MEVGKKDLIYLSDSLASLWPLCLDFNRCFTPLGKKSYSKYTNNPNPSPTVTNCLDWFGLYWFGAVVGIGLFEKVK